jgi:YesN/AraC family two-component response regulator
MRRTKPDCVNLILTGYPAFETALEAIRNQVDDYIVKPAEIPGDLWREALWGHRTL